MGELIGVLSDSHGHADTTRAAVTALLQRGATRLLHLGDIGCDAVIDELVGHNARLVFGNCDYDEAALSSYARSVDVRVDHPMGVITLAGKTIAFTHGHLAGAMIRAMDDKVDYLLHGHSHELRDERVGLTRIINPGALHRAVRYTAALLNPAQDRLEIIELPHDQERPARF